MIRKTLLSLFLAGMLFVMPGIASANNDATVLEVEDMMSQLEETMIQITSEEEAFDSQLLEDALTEAEPNNVLFKQEGTFKDKFKRLIELVVKKVELQSQFVKNSADIYNLDVEIIRNLKEIKYELKDIRKTADRTITYQQYETIKDAYQNMKSEVNAVNLRPGSMTKEVVKCMTYIKNREFVSAVDSVRNIIELQQKQIEILNSVLNCTEVVKNSLQD